jgi:hypothetical protein
MFGMCARFVQRRAHAKYAALLPFAPESTTQLYDRRRDEMSLDEVARVVI